jgi:hypothetical protein
MHPQGDVAPSRVESVSFRPMHVVKLRHPCYVKLKVKCTLASSVLWLAEGYSLVHNSIPKKSHNASLTFASSLSSPLTLHLPSLPLSLPTHPLSRSLSVFDFEYNRDLLSFLYIL